MAANNDMMVPLVLVAGKDDAGGGGLGQWCLWLVFDDEWYCMVLM